MLSHARSASSHWRRIVEALGWFAVTCFLAWIAWSGTETRSALSAASQRAVRVAELRGNFSYLDEWLTMSARLAAQTGDRHWIERYDEASPKLAAVIQESLSLATPDVASALEDTTQEAYRGLSNMHRVAFNYIENHDLNAARTLLDSPEYSYLESVYQSGIDAFGEDLMALAAQRAKSLNRRARLEAAGFALGIILVLASALAKRGNMRLSRALARTELVARTDALTGLPNRRKLYESLHELIIAPSPNLSGFALLILDLDRFKAVNDAHGHQAGDRLLQAVATRLRLAARSGDLMARLGGDEFAIIAPLTANAQQRSDADSAAQLATRIFAAFTEPFNLLDGHSVRIGVSIGVALPQPGDRTADELIHRADLALYRAKSNGRGRLCFFEAHIDQRIRARAMLEAELRQAIEDEVLTPFFQPLVDMRSGRVVAFEMLARWPRPNAEPISPGEFIPLAEAAGLIVPLTNLLLRKACKIAAAWPKAITIACNVSPLLLHDERFIVDLRAILAESGLPSRRLELEITESALLGDLGRAGELIRELKALGVSIALDDFGTGYSSLRHLQALPFDKLKIDAGFVGAMAKDGESRKIVAAVIGLGQSLGLVTVAEGVETEDTNKLLQELGCDIGQGWLYGRPAPEQAATAMAHQSYPQSISPVQALAEPSDA